MTRLDPDNEELLKKLKEKSGETNYGEGMVNTSTPPLNNLQSLEAEQTQRELAQAQAEMQEALAQAALDVAGIFDPTPISDTISLFMSLKNGDLLGAGLSLLSIVPYAGDALAKTTKGARLVEKIGKLRKKITDLTKKLADQGGETLAKLLARTKVVLRPATQLPYDLDAAKKFKATGGKAVIECPEIAKARLVALAKKGITESKIREAAKAGGMTEATAARFLELATDPNFPYIIRVRPTNSECLKWLEKGNPVKPDALKMKTYGELDVLLGVPESSKGLVGIFKPPGNTSGEFIASLNPKLRKKLEKEGKIGDLEKQWQNRFAEYMQYNNDKDLNILKSKGLIKYDDISKSYKGRMKNDNWKYSYESFTGDHDIFDIRTKNGENLTAEELDAVFEELAKPPISAQHGPHANWYPTEEKEKIIKETIDNKHLSTSEKPEALATFSSTPPYFKNSFADQ